MNKLIIIIILIFSSITSCFSQSYMELYPKECYYAKDFYVQHQTLFETAAQKTGLPAKFLFAIVAPELTQYSFLSNKIETYSLKVMYVQFGKGYSDFSIGYFQMKPSFIEALENTVTADKELKLSFHDCLFSEPDSQQARVERIDRLNTVEWQIKYLTLFCVVVNQRFSNVTFANENEKLQFYASAYNCGFYKTESKIKETGDKYSFPHFFQKFKYSDVAIEFYNLL